jgi:Na+-transporting methylmalonyl-CoA/oxaloacetate decarboxylase beta subunit
MKRKAAISCTIIIILCIAALLLLAYKDFSSKTIIGGADFPT